MPGKAGLLGGLLCALLCAAGQVFATDVEFNGQVGYSFQGNTAVLTADKVENKAIGGISGTLRMELWAFATPFSGAAQSGYRLSVFTLGQLQGGFFYSNISSGTIAFLPPPNGTWYFSMLLTEFIGSGSNDGYATRDYVTFASAVVIGPGGGPSFVPVTGVWWNPFESGSGFTIQVRNGVMVMAVYAYKTNGDSEWYLVSGALTNNGTRLVASLDKYRGGQCAGCVYSGPPVYGGSDGTIVVQFTSATSGTITYPNGRVKSIEPYNF